MSIYWLTFNNKNYQKRANFKLKNYIALLYKDILIAGISFTSLSVNVVSTERSFLKFKINKSYLGNSMTQERLVNINLLNIENNGTKKINVNKIINNFAN